MIAFVYGWQQALIQAAAENQTPAFRFNTYIISVLVIFFYQISKKFPKVANVPDIEAKSIDDVPPVNADKFKRAVRQFFQFYGTINAMNHKIVSINTARLEDRFPKPSYQEVQLSPEQKR